MHGTYSGNYILNENASPFSSRFPYLITNLATKNTKGQKNKYFYNFAWGRNQFSIKLYNKSLTKL